MIRAVCLAYGRLPLPRPAANSCWHGSTAGGLSAWSGVEGSGSYGVGLTRHLRAAGVAVVEVNRRCRRMDRHAATRRLRHVATVSGVRIARMHPHMLRHTYVTTMLDAGLSLRDVQIAARHADPRTTMRYDRARKNPDRHANYILATFMASGT
jgi:integrase